MTIGGLLVLEGAPGSRYESVLERVESRLHLIPRYRQKLAPGPVGRAQPVWIDDADFDLRWHVRAAKIPKPGGPFELAGFVASEFARRLDRSRPVWELHV